MKIKVVVHEYACHCAIRKSPQTPTSKTEQQKKRVNASQRRI